MTEHMVSKTPSGDVGPGTIAQYIAWVQEGGRGEINLGGEQGVTKERVIELWTYYAKCLTVFGLLMWTNFEGTEEDSGRTLEIWVHALDPSLAPVGQKILLCTARGGPAPHEISWPGGLGN